ncbi:NAD-dependent epimerase/dehydratase family protein [Microbacterium sp. NPDC080220]|uniref:NAD-dependent epimerase/dehydratase family protein n=1 Tax=Microbacterium sp. NPDC080220 TaxID=3161017 RepID=UPI003433018C
MTSTDIALITGARGGVGSALVARLRARGLRVAAVGRDAASLTAVEADAHIEADVTTPVAGRAQVDPVAREHVRVDPVGGHDHERLGVIAVREVGDGLRVDVEPGGDVRRALVGAGDGESLRAVLREQVRGGHARLVGDGVEHVFLDVVRRGRAGGRQTDGEGGEGQGGECAVHASCLRGCRAAIIGLARHPCPSEG